MSKCSNSSSCNVYIACDEDKKKSYAHERFIAGKSNNPWHNNLVNR